MKLLLLLATLAFAQAADPVKVELYYESLCPYCKAHYTQNGNGWSFSCQHGDDECKGNMITACAQSKLNNINTEMEFVNCMESSSYPPNAGATCAAQVGAEWAPIEICINSVEGQNLLHDIAVKQDALSPSLYYVPWIIVNDFWSDDQVGDCQTNLKRVVCDKYTGTKPAACNQFKLEGGLVGHTMA